MKKSIIFYFKYMLGSKQRNGGGGNSPVGKKGGKDE